MKDGDVRPIDEFTEAASDGLGMPTSATAQSMAFFKGDLYVGTTNPGYRDPEDCPRILRYKPKTGAWDVVYRPPLRQPDRRLNAPDVQSAGRSREGRGRRGRQKSLDVDWPRDFGYRSMHVFQGKSDPESALYVASLSLWGSVILRSVDGETFDVVSEPGLGNDQILSFRGLTQYGGKLFASPAGTINADVIDRNFAPDHHIYVSEDPASGTWRKANESGFGNPANTIYTLGVAHDRLYAGTGNHESGFQIWYTKAKGAPPYDWTLAMGDGGFRYNLNLAAAALVEFQGALYVGGGITGFGYDTTHDIGPAAAELIRILPNGSWDLICGTPRFTPDGIKIPLSGMGPGMDDPFNSVVWSLAVHEGVLYLGMHQWEGFEQVKSSGGSSLNGGYQLWATTDGEDWTRLLHDGNGHPGDIGIRTLLSTPAGLFIGTYNHSDLLQLMARLHRRRNLPTLRRGFTVLRGK